MPDSIIRGGFNWLIRSGQYNSSTGPKVPKLPRYPFLQKLAPPTIIGPNPKRLGGSQGSPTEVQATVSAAEKPLRVCYGNVRIGADLIWVGKVGNASWVFHLRWCIGEISSITKIQLGDEDLPGSAAVTNYLGTTGQGIDATLSSLIGGYTDTLVATIGGETRGIAYSVVVIPYQDMPDTLDFTCELNGLEVLDTRTSTTAYSTNPALHLYDFLTSTFYGPGWDLDTASTNTLANVADGLVGGQKRYEAHTVIERSQPIANHIDTLLAATNAFLAPRDVVVQATSSYTVLANRPASSAETFDLKAVSADRSEVIRPTNIVNAPNFVRVRYTDTTVEPWTEAVAEAKTAAVTAGTEFPRITTLQAPYIHSHRIANRLAIEYLNGAILPEFEIEWIHADDGIRLQRGDVVTLNTIPGFGSSEVVRILRNDLVRTEAGFYRSITARQYNALIYSDAVVDKTAPSGVSVDSPFSPTAVTDVSVAEAPWQDLSGHYQTTLETTWTGVGHAHARSYRVRVSSSAGANILVEEVILHRGESVAHATTSPPVETGVLYTVEIWTVSTVGAVSAADSDTITPVGDALSAPVAPTTLAAVERVWLDDNDNAHSVIKLTWTGISDQWARDYRVRIVTAGQVITNVTVPHLGVASHDYTSPPVEIGVVHTCSVWSINVEGDLSSTADIDTITPLGDVLPPDNVTGLTATEYWGRVDLDWDNVLEAGDLAYRVKRGTQTDTWATATELDHTIYMNPADFAEDTITWSDQDVPKGDKTYFVKGVDKQADESTTAAEIDLSIQTSKGSFKDQNPKVPQYPSEQAQQIYSGNNTIYTWLTELSVSGGQYGNMGQGVAASVGWTTIVDVTGPGVLKFFGMGIKNATSTAGYFGGVGITIDGYQLILQYDYEAPASTADESGLIVAGSLMYGVSSTLPVSVDEDYLPFNESLSISIYKSSANIAVLAAYRYHKTLPEYPVSRPAKMGSLDHLFHLAGTNYLGNTVFGLYTHYLSKGLYTGMNGIIPATSTAWQTLLNITSDSGMLEFFSVAASNTSGGDLGLEVRVTVDGTAYTSSKFTVKNNQQGALHIAGNVTFDTGVSAGISDISFDQFPFDSSLKVESRTPDGTMNLYALYQRFLTS